MLNPSSLENWTYYQTIHLSTGVVVDIAGAFESLGLGADATLGLAVTWTCPSTSMRGGSQASEISHQDSSVQLDITNEPLRGRIDLQVQIILVAPGEEPLSPFSPRIAGTVLWSSEHAIVLEGTGARLPIVSTRFESLDLPNTTGHWYLQISDVDLDSPVDSALRLWVNEESPMMQQVLENMEAPESEFPLMFMQYDMYRQLLHTAIRIKDFELRRDYPEGSYGAALATPWAMLGYRDMNDARAAFDDHPSLIEARLQALVAVA